MTEVRLSFSNRSHDTFELLENADEWAFTYGKREHTGVPGEEEEKKRKKNATASLNIVMAFHCEMLKLAVIRC